jgi:5,10-methylenetetrahydrofolate reductase
MTQQERTQVWARKDQLFKALAQIPASDKRNREHITEQIEACNQALVQNKFELMPQGENSE